LLCIYGRASDRILALSKALTGVGLMVGSRIGRLCDP
jgi:hypothetical protein